MDVVVKAGANPNEPDRRGRKPVFLCYEHLSLLQILDEGRADFTVLDSDGNTLLHHLCWYGFVTK